MIRTFTGTLDGDSLEGAAHIYDECRAFAIEQEEKTKFNFFQLIGNL